MTDTAFEVAVADVLKHEGSIVTDDPLDRGGLTKWGFSLRWNPDLTREQLINMTREQAKDRYYSRWWLPNRWGSLPLRVGVKVFDAAVTMGPADANRCLQRALRACGQAVVEDGACGSKTIAAVKAVPPDALLSALRSEVAAHYRCEAAKDAAQKKWLSGWLNRAYA